MRSANPRQGLNSRSPEYRKYKKYCQSDLDRLNLIRTFASYIQEPIKYKCKINIEDNTGRRIN